MNKVFQVLCLLLAALFFAGALADGKSLAENDGLVCVRLTGHFPQKAEAAQIQKMEEEKEDGKACLFWGSLGEQKVENPSLSRSVQVACVGIYGDGSLYDRRIHTLSKEDSRGCVLDRKTAGELFGSGTVSGKEVVFAGRTYEIRQVIETRERIALFSAQDEMNFTWISLPNNGENPQKVSREFLLGCGLSGEVVSGRFLWKTAGFFQCLVLALPVIWAGCRLLKGCKKEKRPISRGLCLAAFGAVVLFFGWFVRETVRIDVWQLPSKWSDFSFWSGQAEILSANIRHFLQTEKPFWEMERLRIFGKMTASCVFSSLAWAAFVWSSSRKGAQP